MKIILIGFMGSGKSSVAGKLSNLFNWPVIEMDELVLKKTNSKNMAALFAKGGELLLRETELALSEEIASFKESIFSTGGGAVLNKIILKRLKEPDGKIFFLRASFKTLSMRLANDASRPLFKDVKEAESLYNFRQPLYLKAADHVIDVDQKTVEEIAEEIFQKAR